MASLELRNLCKKFKDVTAVGGLSLTVDDGDFLVMVGPSGCGKTTTLRMIAGLEEATSGEILVDGVRIDDVPAKDRNMAMVFQDYALYPYMNVFDNIGFGLKMRKVPKEQIKKQVEEVAEVLELTKLLKRKPYALSGGERQRVALGRAIVRRPKIFLFDEPLTALDAALHVQMRGELRQLHEQLGTTFIYVTHDQVEALTMATKIAVLDHGVLQQADTPYNLYWEPGNKFVARFIGSPKMNMAECFFSLENGELYCYIGKQKLSAPDWMKEQFLESRAVGQKLLFGIRPEHLVFCDEGGLSGKLLYAENAGADTYFYLDIDGFSESVVMRENTFGSAKPGNGVRITFAWENARLFDADSEKRIGGK